MADADRDRLREAILEVVRNQLRARDPPETTETRDRLVAAGYSNKEAMELIGCVVSCELFEITRDKRYFDRQKFVTALAGLPVLPWDQPGGPYEEHSDE